MKIIIDAKAGIVSVDGTAKRVTLPTDYLSLDLLYYDTESAGGFGNILDGRISAGAVLAVSLALWRTSTIFSPPFSVDENGAVLGTGVQGAPGVPGLRGSPGERGERGLKGDMGSLDGMVADPLAYYILAKT